MDDFPTCFHAMQRHFTIADHLTFVTYPLVKDVKLLLQIIDSLHKSILALVDAVLAYERSYKRIGPYSDNIDHKLYIFKTYCMPRYNLSNDFLILYEQLGALVDAHKQSPVEFKRDDQYIICSPTYQLRPITLEQVKGYVINAKPFILKVSNIVKKDVVR